MYKGLENINIPLTGFVRRFYVSNLKNFRFVVRCNTLILRGLLSNEEEITRGNLMAHFPLLWRLLFSEREKYLCFEAISISRTVSEIMHDTIFGRLDCVFPHKPHRHLIIPDTKLIRKKIGTGLLLKVFSITRFFFKKIKRGKTVLGRLREYFWVFSCRRKQAKRFSTLSGYLYSNTNARGVINLVTIG